MWLINKKIWSSNVDQDTCNLTYAQRLDSVIVIDCMYLMGKKTSVKTIVTYIDSDEDLEVILTFANISQVQQLIKQAIKETTSS